MSSRDANASTEAARIEARNEARRYGRVDVMLLPVRLLPVRRERRLTGACNTRNTVGGNALDAVLSGVQNVGALAAGRPAHAVADIVANLAAELAPDLGGVEVELGEGAAEGVAVHAEFVGGL